MKNTEEMIVKIRISARYILAAIALALIVWRPAVIESASMTMTSYYPAPYGGYNQLLATGQAYLGDSSSFSSVVENSSADSVAVYMARNGGKICVGSSNNGVGKCPGTGTGARGDLHVYGNSYFGYPKEGQDSSVYTSTFTGVVRMAGEVHLSRFKGKVLVGSGFSGDPYTNTYYGMVSNIPIGTNKWIYVGQGGGSNTYTNPIQKGSNDNSNYGILVNAGGVGESYVPNGGIGVMYGNYSVGMSVDSSAEARIGGKNNTHLNLTAGGYTGLRIASTGNTPTLTVYGTTYFNAATYFQNTITLNNAVAGTVNALVKGLCYQKVYGMSDTSSCAAGYTLIGFVPNDGISGGFNAQNARGMFYVGSTNAIQPHGGMYADVKADVGYSNPHVLAGGWLTCCAIDLPVVG